MVNTGFFFFVVAPLAPDPLAFWASVCWGISTLMALCLTISQRGKPLPGHLAATYFVATVGFSYITMALVHAGWIHLPNAASYFLLYVTLSPTSADYVLLFALISIFYVIPWVFMECLISHRSPMSFDAALPCLIAPLLLQFITHPVGMLGILCSGLYWCAIAPVTLIFTYIAMAKALERSRKTFPVLVASSAVLSFVLWMFFCPHYC